jgi:hypothetical protein
LFIERVSVLFKGNLQEWLLESDAADQFAVQSEDRRTTIYANALSQPVVVTERIVNLRLEVSFDPLVPFI